MMLNQGDQNEGIAKFMRGRQQAKKKKKQQNQRLAMITEEDESINLQGIEHVGDFADVWKNLSKYNDKYGPEAKGMTIYRPPFETVKEYIKLNIFPL